MSREEERKWFVQKLEFRTQRRLADVEIHIERTQSFVSMRYISGTGTYDKDECLVPHRIVTHLFAYAIFSVYIPLAKNNSRVVIATNNKPLAM